MYKHAFLVCLGLVTTDTKMRNMESNNAQGVSTSTGPIACASMYSGMKPSDLRSLSKVLIIPQSGSQYHSVPSSASFLDPQEHPSSVLGTCHPAHLSERVNCNIIFSYIQTFRQFTLLARMYHVHTFLLNLILGLVLRSCLSLASLFRRCSLSCWSLWATSSSSCFFWNCVTQSGSAGKHIH